VSEKLSNGHFLLSELSIQDLVLMRHLAMRVTAFNVKVCLEALVSAKTAESTLNVLEELALQSRAQFEYHNEFYACLRVMVADDQKSSALMLTRKYYNFTYRVAHSEVVETRRDAEWGREVEKVLGFTAKDYEAALVRIRKALEDAVWTPGEGDDESENETTDPDDVAVTMKGPADPA
jgi:hypothetical protein